MVNFDLRIEGLVGDGDETVLSAVRLVCANCEAITSSTQQWGTWREGGECLSGFDGATLNIQDYKGSNVRSERTLGCLCLCHDVLVPFK